MNVNLRYCMFSLLSKVYIYRVAYLAVKCLTYIYDEHRLAKLSSKTYSTYNASYSFGTARTQSLETPSKFNLKFHHHCLRTLLLFVRLAYDLPDSQASVWTYDSQ